MRYTIKNYVQTAAWDGVLIEDTKGNHYLTYGIKKWKTAEHRPFQVIKPTVELKDRVFANWSESYPYCELIEV